MSANEVAKALRARAAKYAKSCPPQASAELMLAAADLIESLQSKLVERDRECGAQYEILAERNQQLITAHDVIFGAGRRAAELEEQLAASLAREQTAVDIIAKLVLLCDVPAEWRDKVFRRHLNRPGDYMGCGYDFLDGFNRLWDEFTITANDDFLRTVRVEIEHQIAKSGPREAETPVAASTPKSLHRCSTCRHFRDTLEECPCDECIGADRWEAERDD